MKTHAILGQSMGSQFGTCHHRMSVNDDLIPPRVGEELIESCRGPCFVPCLSVLESEEIYRPALHPAWRVEGRWEDVVDVLRHATVVCMHVVLYAGTFAVVVGCGNFCTAPSCMLQLLKVHVGFPPLCRQRYVHTCFDVRVHANGCKA